MKILETKVVMFFRSKGFYLAAQREWWIYGCLKTYQRGEAEAGSE